MQWEDLLAFGRKVEVAKHSNQLTTLNKAELIEDTINNDISRSSQWYSRAEWDCANRKAEQSAWEEAFP